MKHIFLIDPLDKLVLKKDSSLLMAHTAKLLGSSSFVMFLDELYFDNTKNSNIAVYPFESQLKENSFYLDSFSLGDKMAVNLEAGDILHMRLDPPFDLRYLHTLWLLSALQEKGIQVVNNPQGILKFNEKLVAYTESDDIASWVGHSLTQAVAQLEKMRASHINEVIIKPLDLFQGIGVEKFNIAALCESQLRDIVHKKQSEFSGPIVIQPFIKKVSEGEVRSIFYKGQGLGTILKVPKEGEFLANIAQGAKYHQIPLEDELIKKCQSICQKLSPDGVDLIAFDILGGVVSEVNITCPGLLVEVSEACGRNLAETMFS